MAMVIVPLALAACRVQAPVTTGVSSGADKQPTAAPGATAQPPERAPEAPGVVADLVKQRALANANPDFDPEVLALTDTPTSDFKQPPIRASKGDRLALDLNITFADLELVDGVTNQRQKVRLRTYGDEVHGAGIPGPTLIVDPRQLTRAQRHVTLAVHMCNKLGATSCKEQGKESDHSGHGGDANNPDHFQANDTNLHTHGLHVSPSGKSDNVFVLIKPGQYFDYEIQVPKDHAPGTHWYHAHNHGSTATQLSNGMAGALIVAGGLDEARGIKGRNDRLFVFQQVQWDPCQPKDPLKPYNGKQCVGTLAAFGIVDWSQASNTPSRPTRHTLVNGQLKPVFRMNSGEVERWRFIHAGIRQNLKLVLCPAEADGGVTACAKEPHPNSIPLHRVAIDGIATGKIQPMKDLLMGPGYRSDVLVQAPVCPRDPGNADKKCTFYLIDGVTTPADGSLQGVIEQGQVLAVVEVATTTPAAPHVLPTDNDLRKYAPYANVDPKLITNTQDMTYAPTLSDLEKMCSAGDTEACATAEASKRCSANATLVDDCRRKDFNVDGKPFSPARVRSLPGGATGKWVLKAGLTGPHPFHIHVNPFQLASVTCGSDGNGKPIDPLLDITMDGNLWRDTLLVQKGCTYEVYTRYNKALTGKFVQHCHILAHEDQGMMEAVEIVSPPN